jgi:predicted transposase/invertase (TIGR01784 family)
MDRAILRNTVDGARDEGKFEGLKEGLEQGREQGRVEGIEETNRENARRMKAKGYAIEDIAEITGLTTEQINSL